MNDLTFAATLLSCFVAVAFAVVTELSGPVGNAPTAAVTRANAPSVMAKAELDERARFATAPSTR